MADELSQFSIVPRVVWQGCQPREVLVYCALASYVNWDTGVCWPSRATIAETLGVSVSTVDRALRKLVTAGVVEVDKRQSDRGDYDSNVYRLPFAINRRVDKSQGGGGSSAATRRQKREGGGGKYAAQNDTQGTRQGLTPAKTDPASCGHRPIDDAGYCTACGTQFDSGGVE